MMIELNAKNMYHRNESVLFLKTTEEFGGLSNMAGGYPLIINGVHIRTAEALYQACRFPHKPDLQKIIIGQQSPMTAKMKSKPFRNISRSDWDEKRVDIMWWCLRVKLAQNWEKFSSLLLSTDDKPIVEVSYRDQFWGAKPIESDILLGTNVLGQLLTKLREKLKSSTTFELQRVDPPDVPNFSLINMPIEQINPFFKENQHDETQNQNLVLFELYTTSNNTKTDTNIKVLTTEANNQHLGSSPVNRFSANTLPLSYQEPQQLKFDFAYS